MLIILNLFFLIFITSKQRAATRLTKYWKCRIELFGEKAFRNLSDYSVIEDEKDASIALGVVRQLPGTDFSDRSIAFCKLSLLDKKKVCSSAFLHSPVQCCDLLLFIILDPHLTLFTLAKNEIFAPSLTFFS